MAVFNGARYLKEQLETLLADLEEFDEIVVIDDASTDNSSQLVVAFGDPRIRFVAHPTNLGVRRTFEQALRMASHEVIFLCDQDDRWLPGKRAMLLACFENDPECLLAASDCQIIDARSEITGQSFMDTRGGFRSGLLANLLRNRYLGCTLALRRRLLDDALPIPQTAPMHDMWLGLMAVMLGRVHYVPTALIQYRRHGANVTPASHRPFKQMLMWRINLLVGVLSRSVPVIVHARFTRLRRRLSRFQ